MRNLLSSVSSERDSNARRRPCGEERWVQRMQGLGPVASSGPGAALIACRGSGSASRRCRRADGPLRSLRSMVRRTREGTPSAGPRHDPSGRGQAGAPMTHQDAGSGDRPFRVGQAAPHDVTRTPLVRSQPPKVNHDATPPSEPPRLHAPPQYTHRRPPPAPRPLPRKRSRETVESR